MKAKHRWIGLTIALTGLVACVATISGFLLTMANNGLPWRPDQTASDYYLAVGRAYSSGFAVGFFLSFFLVILALAISAVIEHRRKRRSVARAPRM